MKSGGHSSGIPQNYRRTPGICFDGLFYAPRKGTSFLERQMVTITPSADGFSCQVRREDVVEEWGCIDSAGNFEAPPPPHTVLGLITRHEMQALSVLRFYPRLLDVTSDPQHDKAVWKNLQRMAAPHRLPLLQAMCRDELAAKARTSKAKAPPIKTMTPEYRQAFRRMGEEQRMLGTPTTAAMGLCPMI